MATRQELLNSITALLPDNTARLIQPSDVRVITLSLLDSLGALVGPPATQATLISNATVRLADNNSKAITTANLRSSITEISDDYAAEVILAGGTTPGKTDLETEYTATLADDAEVEASDLRRVMNLLVNTTFDWIDTIP